VKSLYFWFDSAFSGVVYAMRRPVSSAHWIAYSATSVLPLPVGAETITDWSASMARIASTWKSSRGKGKRARNRSKRSTRFTVPCGRLPGVNVFHMAVTTSADYVTRREPHRRAHIERLQGLRAAGILIGGGPAPDGRSADLFYRLQQPGQ